MYYLHKTCRSSTLEASQAYQIIQKIANQREYVLTYKLLREFGRSHDILQKNVRAMSARDEYIWNENNAVRPVQ
jgi:phage anti-repressor protein